MYFIHTNTTKINFYIITYEKSSLTVNPLEWLHPFLSDIFCIKSYRSVHTECEIYQIMKKKEMILHCSDSEWPQLTLLDTNIDKKKLISSDKKNGLFFSVSLWDRDKERNLKGNNKFKKIQLIDILCSIIIPPKNTLKS